MSEPTFDDMLSWLKYAHDARYSVDESAAIASAVCTIVEQHRDNNFKVEQFLYNAANRMSVANLAAIRAFVERVEKRLPDYDTGRGADAYLKAYRRAVHDELAAMESDQ